MFGEILRKLKGTVKMKTIENDVQRMLISEEQIHEAVKRIAGEIERDFGDSDKKLLFICILKGSLLFMSDLMKEIKLPLDVDFMKVSSYGSGTVSTGQVKIRCDLDTDSLEDYNVIVIEDIVDTGHTLANLLIHLKNRGAQSVKLCTLLDKPSRRTIDVNIDYKGFTIENEFVIGYGLDFNEKYRNLPYVGVLKKEMYEN